uniref:Uncharacterized protein n=1 Tax=Cereibacter sphaeroides (strain ATCC 17025 / ATH 2.4.3) TaxID=349102 RepID=A4WTE6_CERS5
MTLTTTRITGTVDLPDGATPQMSRVRFVLSKWDKNGANIFVPGPVEVQVASDGTITADLQTTTTLSGGALYEVTLLYYAAATRAQVAQTLGRIAVPAAGPVTLSSLLAVPAPVPNVPDALAQTLAAAAIAQQAVIDAPAAIQAARDAERAQGIAEAARDAATVNAAVYASTAAGLAATTDGQQFQVVSGDEIIRYTRTNSTMATEVARYPSASVAGALPQNQLTVDFQNRSSFVAGQVSGALGVDLQTVAHSVWSVDANGAIDLTGELPTSASARSFWAGHTYRAGEKWEVEVEIELGSDFTSTHGPMLAFGIGSGNVQYVIYEETAALRRLNGSMTSVEPGALPAAMAFTYGERPRLRVVLNGDGTGMAEAIHPSGLRSRMALTGLPTAGRIAAAWRRAPSSGRITSFSARRFVALEIDPWAPPLAKIGLEGDALRSSLTGLRTSSPRVLFEAGVIKITAPSSGGGENRHIKTAYRRTKDVAWEYYVEVQLTGATTTASAGALIAIGDALNDDNARRNYAYLENGVLGRLTNGGTTVAGQTFTAPTFDVGDVVGMRLLVRRDGTGFIEAIGPAGQKVREEIADVPEGAVHLGWRGAEEGTILKFTATPVSDDLFEQAGVPVLALRGFRKLPTPPSIPGRTPPGWTCTGGDVYDFGALSGIVVGADDGRLVEGDASPYSRALHFLTPSFGRVVKTLTLPSPTLASAQGVAVDRGIYPGTLWVAHPGADSTIRNYDAPAGALDGSASAATENAGRSISFSGANGLAFDSDHGAALWVCSASSASAVQIDVVSKTVLRTITLGSSSPDQLQFLSAAAMPDGQARLVYTTGANGADGQVRVYNLTIDQDAAWATLPGVTAIEQFFYDPKTGIGWAFSDRGYHATGADADDPAENRVWFFDMPPLG